MFTRVVFLLALVLVLVVCLAGPAQIAAASDAPPHGASAGEEEGSDVAANLNPLQSWRLDVAIWTGVVFVGLLLVLGKFAWGPIADGLDKREQRIAAEIAAAEKANADAKTLLEEYHQKLAASAEEVRQMIEAAKRQAQQQGQQIVEKARSEAGAERRRALEEIDLATAGALKDLAEQGATLAVELAGKIVHAKLDRAAHADLIRQAVADFSRAAPGRN